MPSCPNHPGSLGVWFCRKCGQTWCPKCVQVVKGVCKSFAFCPKCRDFCEQVSAEDTASAPAK